MGPEPSEADVSRLVVLAAYGEVTLRFRFHALESQIGALLRQPSPASCCLSTVSAAGRVVNPVQDRDLTARRSGPSSLVRLERLPE